MPLRCRCPRPAPVRRHVGEVDCAHDPTSPGEEHKPCVSGIANASQPAGVAFVFIRPVARPDHQMAKIVEGVVSGSIFWIFRGSIVDRCATQEGRLSGRHARSPVCSLRRSTSHLRYPILPDDGVSTVGRNTTAPKVDYVNYYAHSTRFWHLTDRGHAVQSRAASRASMDGPRSR